MNKYIRNILVAVICIYFWYYTKTYTEWHFIDNINLILHEAGHTLSYFFGTFISVFSGSLFQIAIPIVFAIYFFGTGQKLSGSLCLLWVGQNFLNVSVYAGDAISQQLDLLGGDGVIHDWNYLLNSLGMLKYTKIIASTIYSIGFATILLGTGLSIYFSEMMEKENFVQTK